MAGGCTGPVASVLPCWFGREVLGRQEEGRSCAGGGAGVVGPGARLGLHASPVDARPSSALGHVPMKGIGVLDRCGPRSGWCSRSVCAARPLPLTPPLWTGELGLDLCQTRGETSQHAYEEVCKTGGGLEGRNPCARSGARRVRAGAAMRSLAPGGSRAENGDADRCGWVVGVCGSAHPAWGGVVRWSHVQLVLHVPQVLFCNQARFVGIVQKASGPVVVSFAICFGRDGSFEGLASERGAGLGRLEAVVEGIDGCAHGLVDGLDLDQMMVCHRQFSIIKVLQGIDIWLDDHTLLVLGVGEGP